MIVILGAGPCGLGAGFRLHELGFEDFQIFEAQAYVGGLATSFVDPQGFTWDIGGHVQFSHYEDFDRAMDLALPKSWLEHQRESWIWMKERFIPYPFQLNLWRLPEKDLNLCLAGLESRGTQAQPANFEEWIEASFGHGIAELFMKPYNFKVWAHSLNKLDYQWIGERVAKVDLEKVKRNILEKKDELSWGPNAIFRYPLKGGTGAIWKALAEKLPAGKIQTSKRATKIDPLKKEVHFQDGSRIHFSRLLSTLPINKTYELAGYGPAPKLLYSNSHIVGLGIESEKPKELETKCWIYFPESHCPYYRVTVFSNYSPYNVPDSKKHWSLMCEVSESEEKPVKEAELIEECLRALRHQNFIPQNARIVSRWQYSAKPGYPTPFLGRDKIIQELQNTLEKAEIYPRGRFGLWKYEISNQDHTFMQGFEWADRILLNRAELTVQSPEIINAGPKQKLRPKL